MPARHPMTPSNTECVGERSVIGDRTHHYALADLWPLVGAAEIADRMRIGERDSLRRISVPH
jgi:hypothetical protein